VTDATLVCLDDLPAVRLVRRVEVPIEDLWREITERERLATWFPCDVIVDGGTWSPGRAITFPFPRDVIDLTLDGVVREVSPPHLLAFQWGDDELRLELQSAEGGTELVLTNVVAASCAARTAAGWEDCLDRLSRAESLTSWRQRFDAYTRVFTPLLGPQEGPPSGYKATLT
jgi:uncharacterized protein YndB with AHSA1/START domain